jgi:coproporphyrinogen III oxidase-like Fe-S oxidoreductase
LNDLGVDSVQKIDQVHALIAQCAPDQLSAFSLALQPKRSLDRRAFNKQWEPMVADLEKKIQGTHTEIEKIMSIQMQMLNAHIENCRGLLPSKDVNF